MEVKIKWDVPTKECFFLELSSNVVWYNISTKFFRHGTLTSFFTAWGQKDSSETSTQGEAREDGTFTHGGDGDEDLHKEAGQRVLYVLVLDLQEVLGALLEEGIKATRVEST